MGLVTQSYPSTSTVAVTITLASLASGASGVFTAGREAEDVVNSNNDLDHILRGKIRAGGATPVAGRQIQVWAFIPRSIASGTPTWPDQMTGADAARNVTSANVLFSMARLVAAMTVDAVAARDYDFSGVSVASLFGAMPSMYGLYVAHDTGVALDSTGTNHVIHYQRIQANVA